MVVGWSTVLPRCAVLGLEGHDLGFVVHDFDFLGHLPLVVARQLGLVGQRDLPLFLGGTWACPGVSPWSWLPWSRWRPPARRPTAGREDGNADRDYCQDRSPATQPYPTPMVGSAACVHWRDASLVKRSRSNLSLRGGCAALRAGARGTGPSRCPHPVPGYWGGSTACSWDQGRLATTWYSCWPCQLAVMGSVPVLPSAAQSLGCSASIMTAPAWSVTTMP